MEPKFCKFCQELVYSTFCPYCERKAGAMDYDPDAARDDAPEVDEGGGWGSDLSEDGLSAVSFDDVFGAESDND